MEEFTKKINVLIPDGESLLILFVINTLTLYRNVDIHIISNKKWVESRFSRKISSFTYYKTTSEKLDFIDFIKKKIFKNKIDVILPIQFSSILLFSKYQNDFKNLGINIVVSRQKDLSMANNKWELSKFLKVNNFLTPNTISLTQFKKSGIKDLKFPVLVKPLSSWNGKNISKVENISALNKKIKNIENVKNYILQEYITGMDFCINVLCLDGAILAHTIQKGILPKLNPYQPHLGFKFIFNKKIYSLIKEVMHSLNWSGVANFDIRFDTKSQKFYILEINPRFWGSVEASAAVGVNFPYLMCLLSLEQPINKQIYRDEVFISNKGIFKILKMIFKKEEFIKIQNSSIKFALTDPVPKLYKYSNKFFKRISSLRPY